MPAHQWEYLSDNFSLQLSKDPNYSSYSHGNLLDFNLDQMDFHENINFYEYHHYYYHHHRRQHQHQQQIQEETIFHSFYFRYPLEVHITIILHLINPCLALLSERIRIWFVSPTREIFKSVFANFRWF